MILGVTMAVAACVPNGAAFDLLTRHEAIRPTAAPGGLLYCLAKGHQAFQVDGVREKDDVVVGLSVRPVAIEAVQRRSTVLIGGLIPVEGEGAPQNGRRLYVRSVGLIDHLVCIKGAPF
jgi:hypothetical protein